MPTLSFMRSIPWKEFIYWLEFIGHYPIGYEFQTCQSKLLKDIFIINLN